MHYTPLLRVFQLERETPYERKSALDGIRTHNHPLRGRTPYPIGLPRHADPALAGRTHVERLSDTHAAPYDAHFRSGSS